MVASARSELTQILLKLGEDPAASRALTDRLFELVYDELRRLATGVMRGERRDHTLQPTALVHEAYYRLVDQAAIQWQSRAHFFGVVARAMRQLLVEHARRRARIKRGGGWERVAFDEQLGLAAVSEADILELDEALTRLAEMDERMCRVVELRVFAGMTAQEVGHVLGVTRRTVHNDWHVARVWLTRELTGGDES
jgi:RNA polymerase sigma factor (TIGR02999 family)